MVSLQVHRYGSPPMNFIEYLFRLRRFQAKLDELQLTYREDLDRIAKEQGTQSFEWNSLYGEFRLEESNVVSLIRTVQTTWLGARANQLLIPSVDWQNPGNVEELANGSTVATVAALADLRARIRKEEHESSQRALGWIAALTGLGGVFVAALALLKGG